MEQRSYDGKDEKKNVNPISMKLKLFELQFHSTAENKNHQTMNSLNPIELVQESNIQNHK